MSKKVDWFVLVILLLSTVVDLGVIFSGTFINNQTAFYMLKFLMGLGYLIVFIRFLRDADYKCLYYLGGVLLTMGVEEGIYHIKNMYFPLYNIYTNTIFEGVIGAFVYAYFYQLFKKRSYNHVEEFKKKHKLNYDKNKLKI